MERNKEVDNPDQRIQEDVSSFTGFSLSFFLTVIRTTLDLVSFSAILFYISKSLKVLNRFIASLKNSQSFSLQYRNSLLQSSSLQLWVPVQLYWSERF